MKIVPPIEFVTLLGLPDPIEVREGCAAAVPARAAIEMIAKRVNADCMR